MSRLWRRLYLFAGVLLVAGLLAVNPTLPAKAAPGESQVPAPNPDLVPACGIDISMILDESGSIGTSGATPQVKQAFKSFTRALKNTGSRLAVTEFSTVANLPLPSPATDQYTTVTDQTIADIFDPYINNSYSPNGSTNWEDGLRVPRYFLPRPSLAKPLLTVFITDGDPNVVINTSKVTYDPGNPNVAQNQYELLEPLSTSQTQSASVNSAALPAISNANGIKAQGSHILALAVGSALSSQASLNRMISVSGPDVYDGTGTFDIATTDVYRVAQFSQLEEALRQAAFQLCAPSVTVRKLTDLNPDPNVHDIVPGADWDLTARVTPAPPSWVLPAGASGTTATSTTDPSGFASFQWETDGPQTSALTISEEDPAGVPPGFEYDQSATECLIRTPDAPDDKPLPVTVTDSGFTADIPYEAIVTCEMTNKAISRPAISITKETNGVEAEAPPGPFVPVGEPVTWTYDVQNTGNVTLSSVSVVDDPQGAITCPQDTLAPGATMTCSKSAIAEAGQYADLGTVTARDPSGTQVTDSDTSHYVGSAPGLDLEKLVNGQESDLPPGPYVPVGDPVSWSYPITNTGTVDLTEVSVTDSQGFTVTCPSTTLAAGASMTCTAPDTTAEAGLQENVGTVVGTPPVGPVVKDSDPGHYFGVDGSIALVKTTNGQAATTTPGPLVDVGSTVVWNYTVTNTGNVPVTWTIRDDQGVAIACPRIAPELQPGESVTCQANGTATAGQYSNVASVRAVGPDDEVFTADAPSHYFGVQGGITLVKSTNGETPNQPPGPSIAVGRPVNWTYELTNTGNATLSGVVVTDTQGVDVTCPQTTLAVGESITCTASGTARPGRYTNFGQVTARTPTGSEVGDESPSYYYGADPGMSVQKLTNGVNAPAPPGPVIAPGAPVSWTYIVTNTGEAELTGINVTDDQGVTVTCPGTALDAGESFTCTASGTAVLGQHQNVATATGTELGEELTANYTSHYFGGTQSVQVKKLVNGQDANEPPGPSIPVGDNITWTYQVTNTGNIPIIHVTLTDDQGLIPQPVDGAGTGNLEPGATWTYEAHSTAAAGQHRDVATVTAVTQQEKTLTDTDPANYTGESAASGISISKTPHNVTVKKGKNATFTIEVTNTGEVALHNVRVTDAAVPSCARTIGNLAAGATFRYTCTAAHVEKSFRNVAVARGTTPSGGPVAASDSANVRVKHKPRPPCPPPPPHPCKHKHHCKCDGHDGHHRPCPPPPPHPKHHCKCDGPDGHHRPCPPRPPHPHLPNTGGSPLGVLVAGFGATAGGALLSGMWFVRRRRAQLR